MKPDADKEFVLIQEIAKNPLRTQRDLSRSLGLSLGMTNLLLQRLARKGLIKVTHLDWKRTQYLLTPKGMAEKVRKTYHYTLYTLRLFRQIQDNITTVLREEYDRGRREFFVVAQDEVLELVRRTADELALPDAAFAYVSDFGKLPARAGLVFTATLEPPPSAKNGRSYLPIADFGNIDFRVHPAIPEVPCP